MSKDTHLQLRFESDLKTALKDHAKSKGISMNQWCEDLIRRALFNKPKDIITDIVSKEAFEQLDLLICKLREAERLYDKLSIFQEPCDHEYVPEDDKKGFSNSFAICHKCGYKP